MEIKQNYKPLGIKAYGSIGHLPGSKLGDGDHKISNGQAIIATEKVRDKHDTIIVQEKLDGSNVAVVKINNEIIPIIRAGWTITNESRFQHKVFANWVYINQKRFYELLENNERLCGEWLLQAHGTRYNLPHEPFVGFDIILGHERKLYEELIYRTRKYDFVTPSLLNIGSPISIESAMKLQNPKIHGSIDPIEGAVWRVERKNSVDFLTKYVNPQYIPGKYFDEDVWNVPFSDYI